MMNKAFSLENKTALITGGASGLGFAMAKAMVQAGATVVITSIAQNEIDDALEVLGDAGRGYLSDVTDLEGIPAFVAQVEEEVGPIDIFVSNAGNHLKKYVLDTTDAEYLNVLNVHLLGGFAMTREIAKYMVERKSGSIIFITSMSAIFGLTGTVAYTSAKSALKGMARELASELSPDGVRVNAIAPGFIESRLLRQAFNNDPAREEKVLGRTPMNRLGSPEDIGQVAVFLSSDAAGYITGVELPVDGGTSIGF